MIDFGPPPVPLGASTAAPIDIDRVEAVVTFDVAARQATAEATVDFSMGPHDGCPVLDLRQPVDAVVLDGASLPTGAFSHRDLGGGEGAAMRVLDRPLPAGSRHRLEVAYRLETPDARQAQPIGWGERTVRFDLWMSDLHPGRYLEMWFPANLCHDRFAFTVDLAIVGATTDHAMLSNGAGQALSEGRTRIEYPAHFTALSPMLVIAPAHELEIRRRTVEISGRAGPIRLVTARHAEADADVAACEDDIAAWIAHHAVRYGPWAHGDRFTTIIWGPGRGMEYDGATTASVAALEHEVFHSWFGRGIKPARASDGWIDEAWTSWATASRRVEGPRFAEDPLDLDQPPVLLYPPHPWSRHTPTESYSEGAKLFAGLAHLLGGAGKLRSAMATWYQANRGQLVTTAGLQDHLTEWSGTNVSPWFKRYVHGEA
jgi:hypothetical protein